MNDIRLRHVKVKLIRSTSMSKFFHLTLQKAYVMGHDEEITGKLKQDAVLRVNSM